MIISAADVEAGGHLQADLVIVGGGAAGITIANRLAGKSHRVIVLEGGGRTFDEVSQGFYKGAIVGQRLDPLDTTRLRYFGGTTNHWAGWCRPLEASDFKRRSDWPESGWPITRADLDPYYQDAGTLCQLGPMAFDDPSFWQKQRGGQTLTALPLDAKRFRTAIFQTSPPTRFGKVYEPALNAAQNIRVILDSTVLELLPAAANPGQQRKSIGTVRVATKGNKIFTVSARLFVLALGGIETARLMLLSDKVHPAGAGNENDLVGRYFMDHPWMTEGGYLRFANDGVKAPLYFGQNSLAGARIFATITASPELLEQERIGGFRILLVPSRTSTAGADSVRTLMSDLRRGAMPTDLSEHLSNILSDFDVLADTAYKTMTGSTKGWINTDESGPYRGAFVDLNFEQRPNRDSRVLLDNALDANGQRRIRVDWRLNETDKRTATRALDLVAHEFGRIGLGRTRIRLDLANGAPWPGELMGSDHHTGTARMAENPKMGVVDGNCRVHSTTNLYVAGSATFPTGGYTNPTMTIVALAARLADHLQSRLT